MSPRWRILTSLALAGGLGAGLAAGCFSGRDATAPAEGDCSFPLGEGVPGSTIVIIRDFAFVPDEIRVSPGEQVTWVNCEDVEGLGHTSTADAGEWSSPLLLPGDAFTRTFDATGEFSYHCEPHPFMLGRVVVE